MSAKRVGDTIQWREAARYDPNDWAQDLADVAGGPDPESARRFLERSGHRQGTIIAEDGEFYLVAVAGEKGGPREMSKALVDAL